MELQQATAGLPALPVSTHPHQAHRTTRMRCAISTMATTAMAKRMVSLSIASPFTVPASATITNGCSSMIWLMRAMPPIAIAALKTKKAVYWLTRPT